MRWMERLGSVRAALGIERRGTDIHVDDVDQKENLADNEQLECERHRPASLDPISHSEAHSNALDESFFCFGFANE